jgi:hypothetical protein
MGSLPKARVKDCEVRCATRGCEGKFGTLLGPHFNPGRGWKFSGGREEGGRLTGGTWEPRPRPLRGWSDANRQVALDLVGPRDKERLRRRVAEGLNSFSRDARMTNGFVADRKLPGLPAFVRCYACGGLCEVEAPNSP